ncbi:MAG: EVE domain-containing protein [Phycisphaerales bacterium]|nr:EVE domain-containing protein [Phycisphaerales bacterium]
MATYLLKTEPGDYSYDDLLREKRTCWSGVSNPQACKHMRAVRKGDEAFIYHTGNDKRIIGLCKILGSAYQDPDAPGLTAAGEIKRPVFDIAPLRKAKAPVTLAQVKADERFADFALVRQGRLSVMLVPAKLDTLLRKMAGL